MVSDGFLRRIFAADAPQAIALLLILVTVGGYLIFAGLGAASLHDGDEALYATVARAMAESGNVLTPMYWGSPFLHKPPLSYWMMALSLRLFPGAPEFAARLPSAIAALLLLVLVFEAARRLTGSAAAAVAGGALLLNHQFLYEHAARSATFDALLALVMFAALLAGLRAARGVGWAWTFAGLLGAIALIKLPMVVFPAAIVFGHHFRAQRERVWGLAGRAALGFAAVALPWHAYQLALNGRAFFETYVRYEMLGRAGAVQDLAPRMFLHLQAAWMSFLPWSPLIVVALIAVAVGFGKKDRGHPDEAQSIAIYALLILVFFCFVAAKWPWYGIPAYPAAAVALAVFLTRALDSRFRRFVPAALAAVAAFGWFLLRLEPGYAPAARPSYQWPERNPLVTFGASWDGTAGPVLLVILVVLAVVPLRSARTPWRHTAALASVVAAVVILVWQARAVLPVPRRHESAIQRLAQRLEGNGIARLYALGFGREPRYGGRQEPLSSFYLLGIDDTQVISCVTESDCRPPAADGRSALVVSERAIDRAAIERVVSQWKAELPTAEIVMLDPRAPEGFTRR